MFSFRSINLEELAFQFLGVRSVECKKLFVCEFDFRARTNPVTRLLYSLVGRNFFQQYRQLDEGVSKPETFRDCVKVHSKCEDVEKYMKTVENEGDEDEQHEKENSNENADVNISNDNDDLQTEKPIEVKQNNDLRRRKHLLPNLMLFGR